MLYLVAGVLSVLLAVAAKDWWPLLLASASALAATACSLIAMDRRHSHHRVDEVQSHLNRRHKRST